MPKVSFCPGRKALNARRYREMKLAAAGGRKRLPSYDVRPYTLEAQLGPNRPLTDPEMRLPDIRRVRIVRPPPIADQPATAVRQSAGAVPNRAAAATGGRAGEEEEDEGSDEEQDHGGLQEWGEDGEASEEEGSEEEGREEEDGDEEQGDEGGASEGDEGDGEGQGQSGSGGEEDAGDDEGGEEEGEVGYLAYLREKRSTFNQYNPSGLFNGSDRDLCINLGAFLLYIHSKYSLSHRGCQDVYEFFVLMAEEIVRAKRGSAIGVSAEHMIKTAQKSLPPVLSTLTTVPAQQEPVAHQPVVHRPVEVVRKKMVEGRKVLREDVGMSLSGLRKMVYDVHNVALRDDRVTPLDDSWNDVALSTDDVAEVKSGPAKLKFVCIKFENCGRPVPWLICKSKDPNVKVLPQTFLPPLIADLRRLGLRVTLYVADKKERNMVKGMITSNGYASCDHCTKMGCRMMLEPKTAPVRGKVSLASAVYWSRKEPPGRMRTNESMRADARRWQARVAAGRTGGRKGVRGMVAESPLLELPGFDLVKQSPPDPLHMLDLGLTKKLHSMTFVEPHANGQVRRKRQGLEGNPAVVDKLDGTSSAWKAERSRELDAFLEVLRLPSELERRPRAVRHPYQKGSEWRQVGLLHGAHIASHVLRGDRSLAEVWALYTFLYRVLAGRTEIFNRLDAQGSLEAAMSELEKKYEDVFGGECCTSNEHSYFSHGIFFVRQLGPLHKMSTEPYESHYGSARTCFRPGTPGTLKQIFVNNAIRYVHAHSCAARKPLLLRDRATERSDDSIVWARGRFYKLFSAPSGGGLLWGHPIRTERFQFDVGEVRLDWSLAGVHVMRGVDEEARVELNRGEVECKAAVIGDTIVTVRPEWFRC